MKQLRVKIPAKPTFSYPIHIASGLLTKIRIWLKDTTKYDSLVIITDNNVKKLYGKILTQQLNTAGYKIKLLAFPGGEKSKQQKTKQYLEEQMLRQHCGRKTLCLALGGGVVGDLAGFVAATYMRGIPYIQIPTTLLAMVDSSVGGKTAIDTPYGKNLLGAFWQPISVIADLNCLKTLSREQFISGLVEALKMFLTSDAKSLRYAVKNLNKILVCDQNILQNVIYRAVRVKAEVVEKDEKENNLRMILNFGHTIGHALEQITHYKMLHGYAVAYGILVEAKIAEILGILSSKNFLIIQTLFAQLGIVGTALQKINIDQLIKATQLDKKVRTGKVYYVLLKDLGSVYVKKNRYAHVVENVIVKKAFLEICRGDSRTARKITE